MSNTILVGIVGLLPFLRGMVRPSPTLSTVWRPNVKPGSAFREGSAARSAPRPARR